MQPSNGSKSFSHKDWPGFWFKIDNFGLGYGFFEDDLAILLLKFSENLIRGDVNSVEPLSTANYP